MLDSTELLILSLIVNGRKDELIATDRSILSAPVADAVDTQIAALININEWISNHIEADDVHT